jgi:hypothetical protein
MFINLVIREIFFNEKKNAVLLMECDSIDHAKSILNSCPLVNKGLINFDVTSLHPYSGLSRLLNAKIET